MAYYAPFYRPTYYAPIQQDAMNQQFQQPIPQNPQAQQTNDFLWVLNENEATSYPVAPNNTVTLWDKNLPTIYVKSVNMQGVPSMRILDFTERTQNSATTAQTASNPNDEEFVKVDEFNALQAKLDGLAAVVDELKVTKPTKKSKEAE